MELILSRQNYERIFPHLVNPLSRPCKEQRIDVLRSKINSISIIRYFVPKIHSGCIENGSKRVRIPEGQKNCIADARIRRRQAVVVVFIQSFGGRSQEDIHRSTGTLIGRGSICRGERRLNFTFFSCWLIRSFYSATNRRLVWTARTPRRS